MSTLPPTIDSIIAQRKIIITCGTGGVGKTTLSAAIAIRAALLGKRSVVITMDPAKRLANALGFAALSDTPTDLTGQLQAVLDAQSAPSANSQAPSASLFPDPQQPLGTLWAIVPDTRRTFENFVKTLAPNPTIADKVLNNPIFKIFARDFSGTNEYMALERLYSLYQSQQFDCIVLDTPPSQNTLAFLNAPQLLAQFFEEKIVRWLVLPTNQLLSAGMKTTFGILERLTGSGFMTNLFEFAASIVSVQLKFRANLQKITQVLSSPAVGFLMVTTPTLETQNEMNHFLDQLEHHQFNYDGVVFNRLMLPLKMSPQQTTPKTAGASEAADVRADRSQESTTAESAADAALEQAFAIIRARQVREGAVLSKLKESSLLKMAALCARVPEFARDIHSLEDLFHVALVLDQASSPVSAPVSAPAPAP